MRNNIIAGTSYIQLSTNPNRMLENTGRVSFLFYGLFIVITVVAMVVAYRVILKGKIPADKLEKMIELFKYAIVTVAIGTVTLIVSDLFKEREQDVKEIEYFGKYVDEVENVDGIAKRFLLSRYFSIVAPSGPLQEAWRAYYDTTKIEYEKYLQDKKEQAVLDTLPKLTPAQEQKKAELDMRIEQLEAPLASTVKTTPQTVYIQIADEDQRKRGNDLRANLNGGGFNAPGVENVGRKGLYIPGSTEVRYYGEDDLAGALRLITELKAMNLGLKIKDDPVKVKKGKVGTYEIWFSRA